MRTDLRFTVINKWWMQQYIKFSIFTIFEYQVLYEQIVLIYYTKKMKSICSKKHHTTYLPFKDNKIYIKLIFK